METFQRGHPHFSRNSGEMLKVKPATNTELAPTRSTFESPFSVDSSIPIRRSPRTENIPVLPLNQSHKEFESDFEETPVDSPRNVPEEKHFASKPLESLPRKGLEFESNGAEQSGYYPSLPKMTSDEKLERKIQADPVYVPPIPISKSELIFVSKGGEEPVTDSPILESLAPENSTNSDPAPVEKQHSISAVFKKFIEDACTISESINDLAPDSSFPSIQNDQDWSDLSSKSENEEKLGMETSIELPSHVGVKIQEDVKPQTESLSIGQQSDYLNFTESLAKQENVLELVQKLENVESLTKSTKPAESVHEVVAEDNNKIDVQDVVFEEVPESERYDVANPENSVEEIVTEIDSYVPESVRIESIKSLHEHSLNKLAHEEIPSAPFPAEPVYTLTEHERRLIEENNQYFASKPDSLSPEPNAIMNWSQMLMDHQQEPTPRASNRTLESETNRQSENANEFDSLIDDFEVIYDAEEAEGEGQSVPETI